MTHTTTKILHAQLDSVCRTITVYEQAKAALAEKWLPFGEIQEIRLAGLYASIEEGLRKVVKKELNNEYTNQAIRPR
jgi:hypothetical protein